MRLPSTVATMRPQIWIRVAKVAPRLGQWARGTMAATHSPRKEHPVSKVINCECGEVVRAETDDELVSKVEQHVATTHPDLVGKLGRDDILSMAEDE
jgi:predicted small metal-binding protein